MNPNLRATILASLSLLLLCLSYPGMPAPWLAWIALAPLFIAAEERRSAHCAVLFGFWGMLWWCWAVWWLVPAATKFIGLSPVLAISLYAIICLLLSLPYWCIGSLWRLASIKGRPTLSMFSQALLFSTLCSVMQFMIPGNPAHSQYIYPQLIQVVDLGGVPLLLFCLVAFNLCIAKLLLRQRPLTMLSSAALIIALVASYGSFRLGQFQQATVRDSIKIAMIQPNFVREDKLDRLFSLSETISLNNPDIDLLVWPEVPPAFSWSENPADKRRVAQLLAKLGKPLLLNSGYVYADRKAPEGRYYYNAAQLISADAKLLGSYYKQVLVPFFEYLPFETQAPLLRQWFPDSLRYTRGENTAPIPFTDTLMIAPLICYEMIFPEVSANMVHQGANLIINLSNDGWFGDSRGSISHFALASFRSIEHRIPWARVSNGGISAVLTPTGELLPQSQTALNTVHSQVVDIKTYSIDSFFSRYGNVFLWCCGILLCVILGHRLYTERSLTLRK